MRTSTWCLAVVLLATARARTLEERVDVVGLHVDMDGRSPGQLEATRYVVEVEASEVLAPEVALPGLGSVVGIIAETDQEKKPIYSYLGIPYAEAPVGELRFVAPVPKKGWTGVLNATKPGNICYQGVSSVALRKKRELYDLPVGPEDEDCLLLNVHTPKVDSSAKLPVLVFVHGGIFLNGNANIKTPNGLLDEADIVMVSPQYRLGAFGGLNLQTDEVPGNAGLLDLIEVLKWVQKNIEHFGGDPSRVTIGGHSAGAALSSILYLSPLSKGLIHAVFPMSGSALAFWAFDPASDAEEASISIAGFAGCTDKAQLVKCLREAAPMKLKLAQGMYQLSALKGGSLGLSGVIPSLQKAGAAKALTQDPDTILASDTFTPLPYMTGCTKHEGTYPLSILEKGYLGPLKLMNNTSFLRNEMVHVAMKVIDIDDPAGYAADASVGAFFDPTSLGNYPVMRDGLIDMMGSFGFKSPARKIAERNSVLGQPSYLYAFNHNGELTRNNPLGIYHGADQPYLFPEGYDFAEDDLNVAITLRKLVANFVVYQNPTPSGSPVSVAGQSISWPQFARDSEHYLELVWPPTSRQWYRTQLNAARKDNFSGLDDTTVNTLTSTQSSSTASSASLSAATGMAFLALFRWRGL